LYEKILQENFPHFIVFGFLSARCGAIGLIWHYTCSVGKPGLKIDDGIG
jgi:hypothetical protein